MAFDGNVIHDNERRESRLAREAMTEWDRADFYPDGLDDDDVVAERHGRRR